MTVIFQLCCLIGTAACVSLYGIQEPVGNNETVVLSGFGLATAQIMACPGGGDCVPVGLLSPTNTAIKFVLPVTPIGSTWLLKITGNDSSVISQILGLPQLYWSSSTPSTYTGNLSAQSGSTLSLYGRNLAFDGTGLCRPFTAQASPVLSSVHVFAVPTGQIPSPAIAIELAAGSVRSCYRADADITSTLTVGQAYDIWLDNGLTGIGLLPTYGAAVLSGLSIVSPPARPLTILTLGTSQGCDTVQGCITAITQQGGGTIMVPQGTWYMKSSSQIMFPPSVPVAIVGAGRDSTFITWTPGTGLLSNSYPVTGNGSAPWSIQDLTLSLYAAPQPGAQPVLGMDFVHIPSGSTGVRLVRVALINDLSAYPGIQVGNTLSVLNSSFFSLVDVSIVHKGNCASQWPHNTAMFISDNSTDFELRRLNITTFCPGWSVTSSSRFVFADSFINSVGDVSQGQGINTLGQPNVAEHAYYGNNTDTGNPTASERWESMTYDGPGGAANGTMTTPPTSNPDGTQTLHLSGLRCSPWGSASCLAPGQAVAIMRGTGTGQIRRLVSATNDPASVTVDVPFNPAPIPGDSYVSVTGYKGQAAFEGNSYVNGTCFQFYGMAVDTVVAGNTFTEMFDTDAFNRTNVAAGLRLFGHWYQGGYEPNYRNSVVDNALTCTTQFIAYSDNRDNVTFSQGHVFRRNSIAGGVNLGINLVSDPLVEHNVFSSAFCAYSGQTLPGGTVQINGTSPGSVVR